MAEKREFRKINPFTASLDELEEALRAAEADRERCSEIPCGNCASYAKNACEGLFGMDPGNMNCNGYRFLLRGMIELRKQKNQDKTNSQKIRELPCNGCCDSCKWLDSELFKKSGYRFCIHWHNFTISDGFCYAYEGVENQQKPVDNSV